MKPMKRNAGFLAQVQARFKTDDTILIASETVVLTTVVYLVMAAHLWEIQPGSELARELGRRSLTPSEARWIVMLSSLMIALLAQVDANRVYISGETLARRVDVEMDLPSPDVVEEVDIDGKKIVISLKKYDDSQEL